MTDQSPADRLRAARTKAGVTRAQLATKLGISQSTLRAHENGQNGIQPSMAEQYASELGVAPQWILYGMGAGSPEPGLDYRHLMTVPIVGRAAPGYFPDKGRVDPNDHLELTLPGYKGFPLKAYAHGHREGVGGGAYVICVPWSGGDLRLSDEVVLRRAEGDLAEVDIWKVGASAEYVVLYKGDNQSQASEIVKLSHDVMADLGGRSKMWLLGLVVARFEYLAADKLRISDWLVRA